MAKQTAESSPGSRTRQQEADGEQKEPRVGDGSATRVMVHHEPTAPHVFVEGRLIETVAVGRKDSVHRDAGIGEGRAVAGLATDLAHVVGGGVCSGVIFYPETVERHDERQGNRAFVLVHVACCRNAFAQVQDAFPPGECREERAGENHGEPRMEDERREAFPHFPADGDIEQACEVDGPKQCEPPASIDVGLNEGRVPGIFHKRGDTQDGNRDEEQ